MFTSLGIGQYVASEASVVILPRGYKPDGTKRPVIWCHSAGGDATEPIIGSNNTIPHLEAITGLGLPIIACDLGGTGTWGNDTAQSRITSALSYLRSSWGASSALNPILIGISMGGMNALNWARANQAQAVALLFPATSLQAIHDGTGGATATAAGTEAAYGGSLASFNAAVVAHDPAQNTGAYAATPLKVWYASNDTVVGTANQTAFITASGAASQNLGAVGHANMTAVNALDLCKFVKAYAASNVALSPPVNTVAPAITGTATTGNTLTSSTGTWTANPAPTYGYQWKRNGANISGETASTHVLVVADEGQAITSVVTASNSQGSASATSNTVTPSAATFNPSSISGLQVWVKADAAGTTTDGTAISSWTDQSGLGHHLTQATGSKQPLYKAAIQNGLPVIRFDGVDDILGVAFTLPEPTTVFLAGRWRANAAGNDRMSDGAIGTNNAMGFYMMSSGTAVQQHAGAVGASFNTTPLAWHVFTPIYNGASSLIYVDGVAGTAANDGTGPPGGFTLGAAGGGAAYGAVDVGEALVYNSVLSTTDRQNVEAYLKGRWGTP